jgi:hypothetical protein
MSALKPRRVTVTVPAELAPLIRQRMKEERYGSESKFFLGLLLFDLSSRCKHWLTSQLMSEPEEVRDKVIAEIVKDFDELPRRDGGWFRARVKEIIAEHHGRPLADDAE